MKLHSSKSSGEYVLLDSQGNDSVKDKIVNIHGPVSSKRK